MERVGWIGLGLMGSRMLPHLVASGYPTVVYVRDPDAVRPFVASGSRVAASPAEVAAEAEIVFTVVSTPADVRDVYLAPSGVLAGARAGSVLVDMTTSSPVLARTIASTAEAIGIEALDAPMSGGPAGAEAAALSIMVGGPSDAVERVRPLLRLLGTTIVHHGPSGAGQSAKIANQIALAGAMIGICEAFVFAKATDLRQETVLQTICAGIAGSDLLQLIGRDWRRGTLRPGSRRAHDQGPGPSA